MSSWIKVLGLLSLCAGAVVTGWLLIKKDPPPTARQIGTIQAAALVEPSGVAVSRRSNDLLWLHNDSGNDPVLYALSASGILRGTARVTGASSVDWEDIASFTDATGQSWLLIADIGDNHASRRNCALHLVPEPAPDALSPDKPLSVAAAYSVRVEYPDGPHDCEAIAVDSRREEAYLLLKRETPPALYSVSIKPLQPGENRRMLSRVGALRPPPAPSSWQKLQPIPSGRYRAQPTAIDFAADGSAAVVLTYGDVLLFKKTISETWAHALGKSPILLSPHQQKQAEAICFSRNSDLIYLISEERHAKIFSYIKSSQ